MGELIKALFQYIQYMALGAIMVGLIAYFLATVHPLRSWLLEYLQEIAAPWIPTRLGIRLGRTLGVGLLIGVLYYQGVVAIAASYAFVEPLRFATLNCLFQTDPRACVGTGDKGNWISKILCDPALTLPITGHFSSMNRKGNEEYLVAEAIVDNKKDGNLEKILDGELTFARLLRGTAFVAFCASVISLFKIVIVFLYITVFSWWGWSDCLYKHLIDENFKWIKQETALGRGAKYPWTKKMCITLRKVLLPQFIILSFSMGLYVTAIIGYRVTEFEYSSLVKDGASIKDDTRNENARLDATIRMTPR